jgi:hypothetical protein
MAHSAIHFSVGILAATALSAPSLARAFAARRGLAAAVGRWLVWSYALGLYAVIPSLLRRAGAGETFCRGWWMNLFLFHPLLAHWRGGTVVAAAALACTFALQYGVLLGALRIASRRRPAQPSPPCR